MRLQTRLVKLNSYKPENKTENPAKERDFFILYDQNLPRNGNTPYLSTRSSSSSTSKKICDTCRITLMPPLPCEWTGSGTSTSTS